MVRREVLRGIALPLTQVGEEFPLVCPGCSGDIQLISFIIEPGHIRKILTFGRAARASLPRRLRRCHGPLAPSSNAADQPTPSGKTFVYKQSAGQPREMEIYFPLKHNPHRSKVPGLILFHGGGWGGGTLRQFRTTCHSFASRGLGTATANYRMLAKAETAKLLPGETRKRVCRTDAKSASRWFKRHAKEFGIDPARIITGGGSAGGHISVLATTHQGLNDPVDMKDVDASVVAYLLCNPAFACDDRHDPEVDVLGYLKRDLPLAIIFFGTKDPWNVGWDA